MRNYEVKDAESKGLGYGSMRVMVLTRSKPWSKVITTPSSRSATAARRESIDE
jgi:hypothetical protein